MQDDSREESASLLEAQPRELKVGEKVSLKDGIRTIEYMVFSKIGQKYVLAALGNDPIPKQTGSIQIETADGPQNIIIEGQSSIPAIIVKQSNSSPVGERRKNRRIALRFVVELSVDGQEWITYPAANLSERGVLISSQKSFTLSEGQTVFARLHLSGYPTLTVAGMIKRKDAAFPIALPGMVKFAIEFIKVSNEAEEALTSFIGKVETEHDNLQNNKEDAD
jgi:hypothetical protein